jgi:hypothetical protein
VRVGVCRCWVWCCAVLCCAVLCCAVLCCAVLCCAVLCCAVLCCAVLCCAVLCCAMLCCRTLLWYRGLERACSWSVHSATGSGIRTTRASTWYKRCATCVVVPSVFVVTSAVADCFVAAQIDCVRVVGSEVQDMIQRVPPSTEQVKEVGASTPSAKLVFAAESLEARDIRSQYTCREMFRCAADPNRASYRRGFVTLCCAWMFACVVVCALLRCGCRGMLWRVPRGAGEEMIRHLQRNGLLQDAILDCLTAAAHEYLPADQVCVPSTCRRQIHAYAVSRWPLLPHSSPSPICSRRCCRNRCYKPQRSGRALILSLIAIVLLMYVGGSLVLLHVCDIRCSLTRFCVCVCVPAVFTGVQEASGDERHPPLRRGHSVVVHAVRGADC